MRNVILYMSMSLDGFVGSDREHPGMAIPEGVELKQWKLDSISRAGTHLMGRAHTRRCRRTGRSRRILTPRR
jgi:hypothetical protein